VEANSLLFHFGATLFFSLLLGSAAQRLGLPDIVGYLVAGALMGLGPNEVTELMSSLGIILLLFFSGLKMNPRKFGEAGVYALFLSPVKSGIIFVAGYLLGQFLGFEPLESFILGASLACSSTAIISQAILERGWSGRKEARIAISMLILEDVLSVLFIAYLLGMIRVSVPLSKIFIHTFALAFLVLTVGSTAVIKIFKQIRFIAKEEQLPLFALGLITLFSYGVSIFGISPVLGAFFAGLAVASTPIADKIYHKLLHYKKFFTLFFFTSLGMKYTMVFSPKALLLSLLASILVWIQLFIIYVAGPAIGLEVRRSVKLGILMLPLGEFSLFFSAIAQEIGLPHASEMMGGLFLAIIITTTLGSLLLRANDRVADIGERYAPPWLTTIFDPSGIKLDEGMGLGRLPLYILSSFILFYLTGYTATELSLGILPFVLLFLLSSSLYLKALVEIRKIFGERGGIMTGLVSLFGGVLALLTGIIFGVVTLTLMGGAALSFGLLLFGYHLIKSLYIREGEAPSSL